MKNFLALLAIVGILCVGMVGCSSEPQPTEGDAAIIKDTPANTNPPAKALREQANAGPGKVETPDGH
ncbi:MAG: hypothetical protein KF824_13205 [Fimbriimonadaceae bacterium]|nr:MAG: hypothetical protein KF824_13205 [Fimbriimonadaceae bacterium]